MILYLCGFMGCGKTYTGQRLAAKLRCGFADLDDIITAGENRSVPDIFDRVGERGFRSLETSYLAECVRRYGGSAGGADSVAGGDATAIAAVISLGGGAVLTPANVDIIKASGVLVFIDTPFELCYYRICGDQNRPVAAGTTKDELLRRYTARHGIYTAVADRVVSDNQSLDRYSADEIQKLIGR